MFVTLGRRQATQQSGRQKFSGMAGITTHNTDEHDSSNSNILQHRNGNNSNAVNDNNDSNREVENNSDDSDWCRLECRLPVHAISACN